MKNKIFLIVSIGIISLAIFFVKTLFFSKPYCTLEDTKIDNATPTQEKTEKYEKCKPLIIFLKQNATSDQIAALKQELLSTKGVYKVNYISQEEAVSNYKNMNKNDSQLLELMPEGKFLPASFEVYVSNPQLRDSLIDMVKKKEFVEQTI